MKLVIGKVYWQKHCRKWLVYKGKDKVQDGRWHNFNTLEGILYNQLRVDDIEGMFDFELDYDKEVSKFNKVITESLAPERERNEKRKLEEVKAQAIKDNKRRRRNIRKNKTRKSK